MKPLCFILMPFGSKEFGDLTIDFDDVYNSIIKPAIIEAGLEPIRADEERTDGIIHKPMFERLILCQYAIADLTSANANVYYELGVRHAIKERSTILMFAGTSRLPFDVALLRALPYSIDEKGKLNNVGADKNALLAKIKYAMDSEDIDSPLFQLLENYPDISHETTDVFRDQVKYSDEKKSELDKIRKSEQDPEGRLSDLVAFEGGLGDLNAIEAGVIVDLYLSYRAIGTKDAFTKMIELADNMPKPLAATVMIREQKGFALNRLGESAEAEKVLQELIKERGASSETLGILGRVYKDRWEDAVEKDDDIKAPAALRKAIETYVAGFESDIRDAYPGINAATLMYIENPDNPKFAELFPVVRYAVNKKMENKVADYWDNATLFELDVLEGTLDSARANLGEAAGFENLESWMLKTTRKNLGFIIDALEKRGEEITVLQEFDAYLLKCIKELEKKEE